jgi:hypothetical protein
MITKTLGVGGDYPDIGTLYQSFLSPGGMGDDYDVVQISDFVETTGVRNDVGMNFNTHTLTIRNPYGYKTTILSEEKTFYFYANNGDFNDKLVIDGLNVYPPFYYSPYTIFGFYAVPTLVSADATFKNISIFGQGVSGLVYPVGIYSGGNLKCTKAKILNCRIYNFGIGIKTMGYLYNPDCIAPTIIENCACYGCLKGIQTDGNFNADSITTIKNTVCHDNAVKDFDMVSGFTGFQRIINCADSDNTISTSDAVLTDNIIGVVDGDFKSVDPTNANFLKINNTSRLFGSGTTGISSWNTSDFIGLPRPNYRGHVSIGPHEPISVNAILTAKINGQYYTKTKQVDL